MKILNYAFKGKSRVPGSELAYKELFKNLLIEDSDFFHRNKIIDGILMEQQELKNSIKELEKEKILLILGGDHSTTAKIYSFFQDEFSRMILFDAHNDKEEIESGVMCNWNIINYLEREIEKGLCFGYRYNRTNMPLSSKFQYIVYSV